MDEWLKGAGIVLLVAAGYACFMLMRGAVRLSGKAIAHALLPSESRLLQWLQDRATARTLGMDVDVIRARRKIDFSERV